VGALAVQMARNAGARIIGTGRERDRARVLAAGAELFVDLETERFEEVVGQVDVVLDLIGGEILDLSVAVVTPGGTLVSVTAPPKTARLTAARSISSSNRTATSSPAWPAWCSAVG
jgi:NADPH:quinone reductase-like Zn-dependent oxidoreductase